MSHMIKFVFDANVPWDLEKINKLDTIMQVLDNSNFKICMSNDNFIEMHHDVRNKFRKYQFVVIDEPNEMDFKEFRTRIRNENIMLDKKDSAVLYSCNKIDADFIVSSDTHVLLEAKKYIKMFDRKTRAFHLLDVIQYLKKTGILDAKSCLNISLDLYKKKEIPHLVTNHGNELIDNVLKRNDWISDEIKSCMNTFNNYKQHISIYYQL